MGQSKARPTQISNKPSNKTSSTEPLRGVVRKLWPNEREAFLEHLIRLDPVCRRDRFGLTVSDEFLRNYAETTFGLGGFVFGYVEDGVVRGAAELRGLDDLASNSAEAAFSVERDWRRRGIGGLLFQSLITSARNHGHGRLFMTCLRTNNAMKALARKFAADIEAEVDCANGLLDAGAPTAFTLLDEAVEDMAGFAMLSLDIQRRLWPKSWLPTAFIPAMFRWRSRSAEARQKGYTAGGPPSMMGMR
jgi:GNAT superfamily N-acetyltransferase